MTIRDKSPPWVEAGLDPQSSNLNQSPNMKIKLSFYLRIALSIFLLISCASHQDVSPNANKNLLQTNILTDVLDQFTHNNFSMQIVAEYTKARYGLDFNNRYNQMLPSFLTDHPLRLEVRGQDISMADVSLILQKNDIAPTSPIYQYLEVMISLFDIEQEADDMINGFRMLRNRVMQDPWLDKPDRERLDMTFALIMSNYHGLVDAASNIRTSSDARTQGWFSKVWRIVRSVVITASLGAMIGARYGEDGAIVGAVILGAAAIADAAANDNCHFALQCSGGWRQDCSTGECKPYTL